MFALQLTSKVKAKQCKDTRQESMMGYAMERITRTPPRLRQPPNTAVGARHDGSSVEDTLNNESSAINRDTTLPGNVNMYMQTILSQITDSSTAHNSILIYNANTLR